MNDKGNNVIPFKPKTVLEEKITPEQYDLETTYYIINAVCEELEDLGYDMEEDQKKKDISVLANLLYASFQRDHDNIAEHPFHIVLDEAHNLLETVKDYIDSMEESDELDDGDPSNDNRRL